MAYKYDEDRKIYRRKWYERNIERVKETGRAWYLKNKERKKSKFMAIPLSVRRQQRLLRDFKLTKDAFDILMASQKGACAICRKVFITDKVPEGPNIDHDHNCCPKARSCGKCVRGILCSRCNSGIGFLQDSIVLLRRAIRYLLKYRRT